MKSTYKCRMNPMAPPRSISIVQKISAFIAIVGTFLVISFWPVQKDDLSSEQSTESVMSSVSSSNDSISSSASSMQSSIGMETLQSSSSAPVIDPALKKVYDNKRQDFPSRTEKI